MADNVKCANCLYYDRLNRWCYQKRDDPDETLPRNCYWFKKMTNADKIRAMTDEELAKVIAYACDCDLVSGFSCHGKCCDCILDWLKQEVEG